MRTEYLRGFSIPQSGMSVRQMVFWGLLLAVALFLRHPGALLMSQFWGEDSWVWYPQAYEQGAASLLNPETGYLQTFPRLIGLLAQGVPFHLAPTLFALVAFLVQLTPPLFLLTGRLDQAWPDRTSRLLFALFMVALPNSYEVQVNLTNSQWHLAILAFLVLQSTPPQGWGQRLFDGAILLLSGLTGPFCVFLFPIALLRFVAVQDRSHLIRLALVSLCVGLQAITYLHKAHQRVGTELGASLITGMRIIALNIEIGLLFGQHAAADVAGSVFWWQHRSPAVVLCLLGIAALTYACMRGPTIFRDALLASALTFAAALTHPQVSVDQPQWHMMQYSGWSDRYYIFAMLTLLGSFFVLARASRPAVKAAGVSALLLVMGACVRDWHFPFFPMSDFYTKAAEFERAPSGAVITYGIQPSPMTAQIRKR
ncbi:hypothetical protein [Gluconobacter kanchanaburiensis]|uniref:Glucosyltransferase n=1 Tax=Gluconobacter kanchanaburiensis NBRC 103587 TaxID=1307948 RepID=A0A511B3E9_9PROT|nr:hypothetical protein [Gluconobacter kanchanaburiensis]MBF0860878.1 hypothetical protein [Gluconobacter kanchanaburiensis]GBR69966.1 glucosyltransferase [Gluconobacter kanchanaburiensis NBRC 103587]GEK94946.1 hypothetical protein GKA01_01430 [Gluconobacter kanchanaburiensis NBRC 103587]